MPDEAAGDMPDMQSSKRGIGNFLEKETTGAVVLAIATVIALLIANSMWHDEFVHFWEIHAGFFVGGSAFEQSLLHWVDDALMALFFFVVGLEIKREFLVGELSTFRGAALPVVAAVGGMLVPALIFFALNAGTPEARGWGVPMATDIAFALGVLALLGPRVPVALKVFLSALAIADDLGAILVIALFYTAGIQVNWLFLALLPLAALIVMNKIGIDEPLAYLAVGTLLWFAILNSGVHATIAGVIAALTVPATARLSPLQFTQVCRVTIDEIDACDVPGAHTLEDNRQQRLALNLARVAEMSAAPLQRLEFAILPFTTFVVLPLFALANAGVRVVGDVDIQLNSPVVLGVFGGLVIGKPIGITLASWIAVRTGLASLPTGVSWKHIVGAGMLGGIGFTMSMFVANLAFGAGGHGDDVKVAILVASITAGLLGFFWLSRLRESAPA
ncbi:MAG TPA: Na+/H+ antiporter NhaA [Coriobacteriia bacterium]|nr:Na+/H+ antiporter NhaA [Coriobacteriia bacterium]